MSRYIKKNVNPKLQTPLSLEEYVMEFAQNRSYGLAGLLAVLIENSTPETKKAVLEKLRIVEVEE